MVEFIYQECIINGFNYIADISGYSKWFIATEYTNIITE